MFGKTRLVLRSVLSIPILFVIFAIGYIVVHALTKSAALSTTVGLGPVAWFYYYVVLGPSVLLSSSDYKAIGKLGFDGGFPSAHYRRPFRLERHSTRRAAIVPSERTRIDIGTESRNKDTSLLGAVVVLDYAVRGERRLLRKRAWVRNPYLHIVTSEIRHYRRWKRWTTVKTIDLPLGDSTVEETHWKLVRAVSFKAMLLDQDGRYLSRKPRRLKFEGAPGSPPAVPAFVVGRCDGDQPPPPDAPVDAPVAVASTNTSNV